VPLPALHTRQACRRTLPITPTQIAEESIAAAEAGAAILHLHARDPGDGRPTPDPEVFAAFCRGSSRQPRPVVNITTGGGAGMTLDERHPSPTASIQARAVIADMGDDVAHWPTLACGKAFRLAIWEPEMIRGARTRVYQTTATRSSKTILRQLGDGCGTRFELRVLRSRPSLQRRPVSRPRPAQAAGFCPDGL